MRAKRTVRRIATITASVALVAAAPGLTGIASARDNGLGHGSDSSQSQGLNDLTEAQIASVQAARTQYRDTVKGIRDAVKLVLDGVKTASRETLTPLRDKVRAAHDAYEAALDGTGDVTATKAALDTAKADYTKALETLRTQYQKTVDDAVAKAKTDLEGAAATYKAAILAISPAVPVALQTPPGRGLGRGLMQGNHFGWMSGSHWKGLDDGQHRGGSSHRQGNGNQS